MSGRWADTIYAWSHPPVEGVGYPPAAELVEYHEARLRDVITMAERERYMGWRNHEGRWRRTLHAGVAGRTIMDFGCGLGLEALALADAGAAVILADITPTNVRLAERVLSLGSHTDPGRVLITQFYPYVVWAEDSIDIFYCNGVLHHIPWDRGIMRRAHELLRHGGEVRLMVYTDQAWREAVGTDPPHNVTADPGFRTYVRHMDAVGDYADYYTPDRLTDRFGDLFTLREWVPLGPTGIYAAAILEPKGLR